MATCSREKGGVASKYLQTWNIYYSLDIFFPLELTEVENLNLYFIVDLDADKEERENASWTTWKIIRSQRHKFLSLAFTI